MGVDDELLKRFGKGKPEPAPAFDERAFKPLFNRPSAPKAPAKSRPEHVNFKELRSEIRRLTSSINELLQVFSKAHEDIKTEPATDFNKKMDKLVEQNEEIGRALLLLLELHRENLPQIAKHTRMSSELRLRKPPAQLYSERVKK
ncbi:hypothetical protein CMO88_02435 [Candidatus Woesearchaeota archaeon]|nr:hypothetical protein [Candidatus Woesearchaeota archaeon]|tara:strand:+ start:12632 stop:13066 length:435 start_codon:yes stop_codon:yes gene_type:complete